MYFSILTSQQKVMSWYKINDISKDSVMMQWSGPEVKTCTLILRPENQYNIVITLYFHILSWKSSTYTANYKKPGAKCVSSDNKKERVPSTQLLVYYKLLIFIITTSFGLRPTSSKII